MSTEQLKLFDVASPQPKGNKPSAKDNEALDDYANLYTATSTGQCSGIHFVMTTDDAKKWCSSDLSRCKNHSWAYFFTTVKNYLSCIWMGDSDVLDLTGLKDDGLWDDKLALVGVRKIPVQTLPELFKPFGVTVKVKVPKKGT